MNIEKVVEKLIVKSCRNPLREVKIIILLVQKGVLIPLSYAKGRNPLREAKIIILLIWTGNITPMHYQCRNPLIEVISLFFKHSQS